MMKSAKMCPCHIVTKWHMKFQWKRQDNIASQCHMNIVPTIRKKYPGKFVFQEYPNNTAVGNDLLKQQLLYRQD